MNCGIMQQMGLIRSLKEILQLVWISIKQSVMEFGIVYVFIEFVVRDWS